MTKNEKNVIQFVEIEVTGFQQICNRISTLEKENEQLQANNKIMADELTYFKEYAADLEDDVNKLKNRFRKLSTENHDLSLEIKDMKFTRNYLLSEDVGRTFARELLGKPMTPEEVVIESAENKHDFYTGDDF